MTRKCTNRICSHISNGYFIGKNRCPICGERTEKLKPKKLKDVDGFVPKEDIYKC